jgi:hypothetical protein
MITSAKQTVRFTPRALCNDKGKPNPGAVVYLIQPPTLHTRAEWHRLLSDQGAKHVSGDTLYASMRRGINKVVAEDQRAELLEFLDNYEPRLAEYRDDIIDANARSEGLEDGSDEAKAIGAELLSIFEKITDLKDQMDDLEGQMRRMFPPYGRKFGEQLFWMQMAPLTAAAMFLVGAENSEIEISRTAGLVLDETLSALPSGHALEIGWHAVGLMNTIGDDLKNSDGPSSSASKPKRSARTKTAPGTSSASK